MSTYPHRYGDTDRSREHYATACVASAGDAAQRRPPSRGRRPRSSRHASARHQPRPPTDTSPGDNRPT